MRGTSPVLFSLVLAFGPGHAAAQQGGEGAECRPDELDMGDYCAGLPQPTSSREAGLQRLTPFRVRSMMPGHAGEDAEAPVADLPHNTLDTRAGSGYGVQLGVFAQRTTAESVARKAAKHVSGPYQIAPLVRGERILWASIHGPFPDRESAASARQRLVSVGLPRDVFVKPLKELKLIELNHASTQE